MEGCSVQNSLSNVLACDICSCQEAKAKSLAIIIVHLDFNVIFSKTLANPGVLR